MSAHRAVTFLVVAVALTSGAVVVPSLHAQTCTVPGSHATIQAAADDPACATIALAAQTYPEPVVLRHTLTIAGPAAGGAFVQGLVLIAGASTMATLNDFRVENGCVPDAVRTVSGARLNGNNLQVERSTGLPCPATGDTIFTDGFESGNTGAWSGTTP